MASLRQLAEEKGSKIRAISAAEPLTPIAE